MDSSFDADRALVASQSSQQVVSTKGFDHGEGAWRPALIAYWKAECCFQRAENLAHGCPLDEIDRRAIQAIEAANAVRIAA